MDDSSIQGAERLIAHLRQNPSEIHDSRLTFLRSYLASLNAEMPAVQSGPVRSVDSLESWKKLLDEAGSTPVVVDAFATWCGPCKAIAPLYEKFAVEYKGRVIFSRYDVDKATDLAAEMNVSAMPTFRLFKDGKEIGSLVGADPNKLEDMIKKAAEDRTDTNGGMKEEHVHEEKMEDAQQEEEKEDEDEDEDEKKAIEEEHALVEEFNRDAGVLAMEDRDTNPSELPVGDMHAKLSEADIDRMISLKQEASQYAASEEWEAALEKYNELMGLSPSTLSLAKRADVLLHLKRPCAAIRDCETALAENDSSAKALKTRGKAYAMIGEWEKAAKDLQKGNALDFDEEAGRAETEVEMRWNQIRELRLKRDAKRREKAVEKEKKERERRRREAVKRYEEEKAREEKPREANFKEQDSTGSTPNLDTLLGSLNLPADVKEKVKRPEVRAKLMKVFQEMQSSTPDKAMSSILKYIGDPDVGPIVQAAMSSMMGGAGAAPHPSAQASATAGANADGTAETTADAGTTTNDSGLGGMGGFSTNLADEVD
ncbi:58 kDa phosphoprotein [Gracilariopsis chorda]|uniref:58 kDa phosphoprotein n=1 Tax=Gracilariopsis chorda TaxID=448386 RepID=A0A2V3IN29_9FLOR|nr:58 kDa phosphoprotein [Gracilariopsis chorda]|eukprot:PXF43494.1 58 kDa phosphoprotein [Gracilariopsis chorda]